MLVFFFFGGVIASGYIASGYSWDNFQLVGPLRYTFETCARVGMGLESNNQQTLQVPKMEESSPI